MDRNRSTNGPAPRSSRLVRCSPKGEGGRGEVGFTLIEMLVVIIIIIVITSMSLVFLGPFLQGNEVKRAGRIVHAAFSKGRQLAGQKRRIHYLLFDSTMNSISLWEDTDNDKRYTAADQRVADQAVVLPGRIGFARGPNAIINNVTRVVGIRPDGSLTQGDAATANKQLSEYKTASAFDAGLVNPNTASGDIVLQPINPAGGPWPTGSVVDTVLIDLDALTGIVRKVEYVRTTNRSF